MTRLRVGNGIALLLGAVALSLGAGPTAAQAAVHCPLRDQSYSTRSPLIDILLKPEAKAVLERDAPGLLKRVPKMFTTTTVPTFASIMTIRTLYGFAAPNAALDVLDRDLAALRITAADRRGRCARYDTNRPKIELPAGKPAILLFEKMTGYRDTPSVEAAHAALLAMAGRKGWTMVATDQGGAITPAILKRFDAVIWNNVSGDVLTIEQREALRHYVETGGGFLAFHGSAGDPVYFWDWYVNTLIGARFIGHPMGPQFQDAQIRVDDPANAITKTLAPGWTMNDEWYSFRPGARTGGAHVLLTLDESSYSPKGFGGQDLRMGDHPIAWTRCVVNGRSFYSAIGHRPESYSEPHHLELLENAITWVTGRGATRCERGREVANAR